MPLCTLHLLSFEPAPNSASSFVRALHGTLPIDLQPLIAARPIRWIITPTSIDNVALLDPLSSISSQSSPPASKPFGPHSSATVWDLLLVLPDQTSLPTSLQPQPRASYSLSVGIPASVLNTLRDNKPPPPSPPLDSRNSQPPLLSTTTQSLGLTPELLAWTHTYWRHERHGHSAVSMLNLLAFAYPQKKAHESYNAYGRAFANTVGKAYGGWAKVVAKVVKKHGEEEKLNGAWEEMALARYPSMEHFCGMAGSEEYQRVNWEKRVPALRDTAILMCVEVGEEELGDMKRGESRL